jgi:hypothetical protein
MPLRIALGTSDFLQLRLDGLHYVDKSLLVSDILKDTARVLLLPRPRRFGKTLNLSTLRYFVERPIEGGPEADDVRRAFSGLEVEKHGEDVWAYFRKHPVVFLTFKDVKGGGWSPHGAIAHVIGEEAERLSGAFKSGRGAADPTSLTGLVSRKAEPGLLERSLRLLSQWLHQATGEKAIVLIDEYDTLLSALLGCLFSRFARWPSAAVVVERDVEKPQYVFVEAG